MLTLSPWMAADIADGVYNVLPVDGPMFHGPLNKLGCEEHFDVNITGVYQGESGVAFGKKSGFGYIAFGTGSYQGHVLCATRGTGTWRDGLTDMYMPASIGPSGHVVHKGFNEVFKSAVPAVNAALKMRNPTHVHCVGHSLGGALAMLFADYFTQRKIPATVYTFGAPRVGLDGFARSLTERMGANRIFRLSHVGDPVPMVPIYPYQHAAVGRRSFEVANKVEKSLFLGPVEPHFLDKGYKPFLFKKSWSDFAVEHVPITEQEIQRWMDSTSGGSKVLTGSVEALRTVSRVLSYLIREAAIMTLGQTVFGAFTALDQVAMLLQKAAALSKKLGTILLSAIRAILRFLGYVATTVETLTTRFLTWVLDLLFRTVSLAASKAVAAVTR